jgi:hypothetical protein
MLSNLLNRSCQIVRRGLSGVEDDYGNEIAGETVVSTVCELQQDMAVEITGHEDLSRTRWRCFFPADTDIDGTDRVIIDAERYEIDGDPWSVRNPRTQQMSHVEAHLIRVSGEGGS